MLAFNLSTQLAKAHRSLCVQGHPGLHSKLQATQGYMVRPYLKNKTKCCLEKESTGFISQSKAGERVYDMKEAKHHVLGW